MANTNVTINPILLSLLSKQKSIKNNIIKPPTSTAKQRHDSNRGYSGTSDPIKSEEDILKAKDYFLNQPQRFKNNKLNIRNYLLFTVGLNCGRRFGDIRNFTFSTFLNSNGTCKDYLEIKEQKTGKLAKIYINSAIKEALNMYIDQIEEYSLDDYLFQSRTHSYKGKQDKRITIQQANRIYNQMSEAIGLKDKGLRITTHSARKTAVYRMIQSNPQDIRTLMNVQKFCNHNNLRTTLRYAGIEQGEIDTLTQNISI